MSNSLKEKVERFLLPYVKNPLRYIGKELNIIKKELSQITVHGVLCFPEIYEIGMSHTGLQILYNIVNSKKEWVLSRCFHPWIDAEEIMRRENIPLYTLES
ncbi:MAG: hypothetical protein N2053_09810, partial [Chitinispirillaceae bacterium]|nr:hypothetical protein [Chitinispirillaceae bacterium]